ncbi:MAG: glycerol-3-phosphate 1-O-acyltransferase PlsY [Fimbriimonas sp.]|nr:glycerol-3-phosphate 1-O-acyltransferase PlsY [Fimbriimonas sp.]
MNLLLILLYVGAYLCGGIPFGVVIARRKGIDLMKVGSGNIGATNVKRALGGKVALLVFFLDVAKGTAPCLIARLVVPEHHNYFCGLGGLVEAQSNQGIPAQMFWLAAGLIAIVGHCASPFLRFKGGKGVSTALGMVIGSAPLVAAAAFGLFLVILLATRYMSIASMVGVGSATVFGWVFPSQARELVPLYALLTVFVVYRHRENVKRLMQGTERRFNFGKERSDDDPNGAEFGSGSDDFPNSNEHPASPDQSST